MEYINKLIEYSERRVDEAIKNSGANDIEYWKGYRDAAKRIALYIEKEY